MIDVGIYKFVVNKDVGGFYMIDTKYDTKYNLRELSNVSIR